uniref:Uncharacterized protein n=1 Tax=Bionectria ochroleuca TaxID=29856 RepID=A0A8H7TT53_BIOOC
MGHGCDVVWVDEFPEPVGLVTATPSHHRLHRHHRDHRGEPGSGPVPDDTQRDVRHLPLGFHLARTQLFHFLPLYHSFEAIPSLRPTALAVALKPKTLRQTANQTYSSSQVFFIILGRTTALSAHHEHLPS